MLQCLLMDLLLLRKDSKAVILAVCRDMLRPQRHASLATIAAIFDKLNSVYFDCLQYEMTLLVAATGHRTLVYVQST